MHLILPQVDYKQFTDIFACLTETSFWDPQRSVLEISALTTKISSGLMIYIHTNCRHVSSQLLVTSRSVILFRHSGLLWNQKQHVKHICCY